MKIVIYHANCADGFCSAYIAKQFWPDATFIPAQCGDSLPKFPEDKEADVLICDFSYPRDVLIDLKGKVNSLLVLDHHKTAMANCVNDNGKVLDFCRFDLEKSGARLTFEYFLSLPTPRPTLRSTLGNLVSYIEDRDLWRWNLPDSRAVSAFIASFDLTFDAWDDLFRVRDIGGVDESIRQGYAILRYQEKQVRAKVQQAKLMDWTMPDERTYEDVPIINCTELISETLNELAKNKPFAIGWFHNGTEYIYSLRSSSEGMDVSKIAKQYGGGGHAHAAGFKTDELIIDSSR